MSAKPGKLGWIAAGVIAAAAVGAGGWWMGSRGGSGEGPAQPPQAQTATQASSSAPSASQTASVGNDPFAALSCQPRQYNDSMALAVTFTQPLDRKADLSSYFQVVDTGASKDEPGESAASSSIEVGRDDGSAVEGKAQEGRWVVGDNPRVAYFPYVGTQRNYVVRIKSGLPGDGGAAQPSAARCEVATQAMAPAFHFASRGVVLPAGQNGGLPVVTVNVPEVDVQFLRIEPKNIPQFFGKVLGVGAAAGNDEGGEEEIDWRSDWRYADNRSMQGLVGNWDLDRLHSLTTSAYQGRFVTSDKRDSRHVTFLPVEEIEPLREPGIYVAVMSEPGRFRYEYQVTYFYVSDIGVHARRYPDGIDAYAVSLKEGKPLAGVAFSLVDEAGRVLAEAKADDQGRARFEGDHAKARLIRAQREREMTVLALGEPALDLSEFAVNGNPLRRNSLFVYAGRDLYRPGETFTVSVLPRDADGRPLPAMPLTATLKRPDGRTASTQLWQLDEKIGGYLQRDISMPVDAPTGAWTLELRVDPSARTPDSTWRFQVEEFMPERMKLALESSAGTLTPGEDWTVDVQGDYLYGAPAEGNRLLASFRVARDRFALASKWPGFIFGDSADDSRRAFGELPETVLDSQGRATLDVNALPQTSGHGDPQSPMRVRLSVSLLESGGRPVVRSIERTSWPGDVMVGVRPLFAQDVAREGAPAQFELIRVDNAGAVKPVQGAQVKLYRENRQYYWRYDDQRGWNSGYVDNDELVDARVIDVGDRTALTVPVVWGTYRLEVRDPDTGLTARYRFYAGWSAEAAQAMGNRPDRVQLKLEGTPAQPGKSVRLTMTPPHDGQALVTVEGDKLLWSRWMPVQAAGTSVEIPIDPAWKRHDLYVSATVFRPGSQGDRVTPARAVGLAYVPLDSASRSLKVSLSAPQQARPERAVEVAVKVEGAQGKRALVTLSAVDVGILNINQYKTPDPLAFFFGQQRYAAELLDMYGKLIEKMAGQRGRLKWGGDAALRGDSRSLPRKVRLVDLFSGPVALNEQGEAIVSVNLPDFNGTLRLMAVAFTDEQYGSADREMTVSAPIVAETSLPRFITPGDRATVALDLANMSGQNQTLSVRLDTEDALRIEEPSRTVKLANGQRTILRFAAIAGGGHGLTPIRVHVEGQAGGEPLRIARTEYLQVQPAHAPERRVRRLRLEPGATLALKREWVEAYHPASVTAGLMLSNRPAIDVARLVKDLLGYPYGCTEQTISAAMPWLLIDDASAERFGLSVPKPGQREARIASALSRLAGMGSSAGTYSLWGEGSRDLWLTAYVAGFMQAARAQGHTVPAQSYERTSRWLLEQIQQAGNGFGTWSRDLKSGLSQGKVDASSASVLRNDHRRFAGLAEAALVLARDGAVPLAAVRLLFDNYAERARSPLPLVQLAAAFKLLGDEARAASAMDLAMQRDYGIPVQGGYNGWLGDYGSAVRDYAQAYAIASEEGLSHERRELMLEMANDLLNGRSYLSTQEQMALLRAARAAGGKPGERWQAVVAQADKRRSVGGAESESLSLDVNGFVAGEIVNAGTGPLFIELDIQGSPETAPAARSDVIQTQRRWYYPDGRQWQGEPLRTGDMLVARLTVKANTTIPNGLVVDRVPAGLEVDNANLSQGDNLRDWQIGGRYVAEAMSDDAIAHREFRDDRFVAGLNLPRGREVDVFYMLRVVTPGSYRVPSVVAEDMYRPELRGVSEPWGVVEVIDRKPAARR